MGSTERAVGSAYEPDDCDVSVMAELPNGDTSSATVYAVKSGGATGTWKQTSGGDHFVLTVTYASCRRDGGGDPDHDRGTDANIGELEGTGTLNGVPGYEFVATVHDHTRCVELSAHLADDYALVITDGVTIYHYGGLVSEGDIQIVAPMHPFLPPCNAPPSLGGVAAYPELPSAPGAWPAIGALACSMATLLVLGALAWRRTAPASRG